MHLKTAAAGESLATYIALVRFDAVVRTHMSRQVASTDESPMADLTNVRLLAGMRAQMYDGRFVSGKCLGAIGVLAWIRTFAGV